MKRLLTIILLQVICSVLPAQKVSFGMNWNAAGRDITTQYELKRRQHEWSLGLGYNINKLAHNDDQNNVYLRRLYATKAIHHLNLSMSYQRYVAASRTHCVLPFIFFDLQAKYSTTRNRMILPYKYDSTLVVDNPDQGILYREYIEYFGPFVWLLPTIGFGFSADVTDRLYIKQRFGAGVLYIIGNDKRLPTHKLRGWSWEFGEEIHMSIGYRLASKRARSDKSR